MSLAFTKRSDTYALEFFIEKNGQKVGFAFLVVIQNNKHKEPYGLLENVYVELEHRGKGYGKSLVQAVMEKAKELGCYKLVANSRYGKDHVHGWYTSIGMQDWGKEFRIDLKNSPSLQESYG
ncbi:GNAT family N-acetyltransferase [Candidatus Nomurabacteria bacterium]|nr:GNAT family N-acetyltransferase [Candidatus Nomurabacteria bacterium]